MVCLRTCIHTHICVYNIQEFIVYLEKGPLFFVCARVPVNACLYVCRSYTGDPECVCTCMGRLDVNFGYFLCSPSTLYTEAQSLTTSQLTPRVPFLPPEGSDYRQSTHSLGIYLGAWVLNSSPHANPYPEPQTVRS